MLTKYHCKYTETKKREFKYKEKTQIQIQNTIDEIAKWEAGQYVEGRYLISGQISAKCSSSLEIRGNLTFST